MIISYLGFYTYRRGNRLTGNKIDIACSQLRFEKIGVFTENDCIALNILFYHVGRLAKRYAKSLALSYGIFNNTLMFTENIAVDINKKYIKYIFIYDSDNSS